MEVVSLIPARGGSKGIPRKNIKSLNGKPLLAYTIEASLVAKIVNRTIVSTDDKEIAQISKDHGAEVPFMRPDNLSGDSSPDYPVIEHCIEYLHISENYYPDIIVLLRPTMPTRNSNEIDSVVNILINDQKAASIRTARPTPYPPFWMKAINRDGYLEPYDNHISPYSSMRRQDLPPVMVCDGYVDAAKVSSVIEEKKFPPGKTLAYFRQDGPFIDIDSQDDWEYCEYIFRNRKI